MANQKETNKTSSRLECSQPRDHMIARSDEHRNYYTSQLALWNNSKVRRFLDSSGTINHKLVTYVTQNTFLTLDEKQTMLEAFMFWETELLSKTSKRWIFATNFSDIWCQNKMFVAMERGKNDPVFVSHLERWRIYSIYLVADTYGAPFVSIFFFGLILNFLLSLHAWCWNTYLDCLTHFFSLSSLCVYHIYSIRRRGV